ncbi:class I SAM-dependent methyltransferase [Alkalicoccus daliensis]|uniref:Putative SAM-dependent methyltransferase n=1 Tax=Alkalicoccus daliensis TaxID=745820 RepID=A0A1H0AA32_9BACI|nr:class I SAM-dependent methyltransferase [Alkalicoccus daliensis]SDN30469.1 Putative SAM-dependent methyltransferase [Alkalicoccus daliensis]
MMTPGSFITTGVKNAEHMEEKARSLAETYGLTFIKRNKYSVKEIIKKHDGPLFVLTQDKLTYYSADNKPPLFYHPNIAAVRAKNWRNIQKDLLVEACNLKAGDKIIDGTLGLGADSLILALAGGKHTKVTSVEKNQVTAMLVREGLKSYAMPFEALQEAAKRIKVVNAEACTYLKTLDDNSVDIVYFDPMFESTLDTSSGMQTLRHYADHQGLTANLIEEAKRVALKRVVVKARHSSSIFKDFGFFRIARSNIKSVHYGYISLKEV